MSGRLPFPVKSLDDAAEGTFSQRDETSPRDRRFHFRLLLPADWRRLGRAGEAPTRSNPAALLARYVPVDEPGAEVAVTGRLLGREVAPADVLQIELERSKEKILERHLFDSPDGGSIDVLSERRAESGVHVLRRSAVKQGNRMLVLCAAATAETYDRWADRLAVATAGLRFLQPGTWHCAEALSTLSRKRPSDFLLFYPESWRLEEPAAAQPGLLSACLLSASGDRVAGRIDLAVVSRAALPGPHAVADGYLAALRAAGFEGPPVRLTPLPAPAAYQLAWEGTGEQTSGDCRAEVRVRVGQRPEAWFCFALLGPTRDSAPDVWAVNRRALELAFSLVATPDAPMQGWIAESIERSRSPRQPVAAPPARS